jgi:hypothetical protein
VADRLEAKIGAILRDLPLVAGVNDQDITDFSRNFALIGSAGRASNRPIATQRSIGEYLDKIRGEARKLIGQFDRMPPQALSAMGLDPMSQMRLVETLLEIVWRAEDGAKDCQNKLKSNPRRPPNVQAICATLKARRAWQSLTGRKPSPGYKDRVSGERSDFEQFLSRIFAALEINANVEHYARGQGRGEAWLNLLKERLALHDRGN